MRCSGYHGNWPNFLFDFMAFCFGVWVLVCKNECFLRYEHMSCVLGHVLRLASWAPWDSQCAVGLGVFLRSTSVKKKEKELQVAQEPGTFPATLQWVSQYLLAFLGCFIGPQEGVLLWVNYLSEIEAVPEWVESRTSSLPTSLTFDMGGTYLDPSTLWKLAKHQYAHRIFLLQRRNWGLVRVSFDWKPRSHWVLIL